MRDKIHFIHTLNKKSHTHTAVGLKDIELREEYRSDRNDIVTEFFYPCLSQCTEYRRCVDLLSIHSLTAIAMGFENFSAGDARLRMITGHRFRIRDLDILGRIFSDGRGKTFDGMLIKDSKLQKLKDIVDRGQIEIKIAIPNSEQVAESFSERIGIFADREDQMVAFTGTSKESFSTQTRDFESVDVFTSWNDKSRVALKVKDFEELWVNKTKYVEVHDFMHAYNSNLLKFAIDWVFEG